MTPCSYSINVLCLLLLELLILWTLYIGEKIPQKDDVWFRRAVRKMLLAQVKYIFGPRRFIMRYYWLVKFGFQPPKELPRLWTRTTDKAEGK